MLRAIVIINIILLAACSTQKLPRARCDAQLVPINRVAVDARGSESALNGDHNGEKP
jgi:hypothetical protein